MTRPLRVGVAVILSACACARDSGTPTSAEPGMMVLTEMRAKHATPAAGLALIKSASFTDGRKQRWYEVIQPPGLRRLDVEPVDSLNGLLFRADSLYEISRGTIAKARPYVHVLSLLSYDVYALPPAEVARRLTKLGFDLKTLRVATWQDRPTYVVGAQDGDRTTNQFWIDRQGLYPVRLIERRSAENDDPKRPPLVQEVWLSGHRQINGQWIPAEVDYFYNGRQFLHERVEVRPVPTALDSNAFRPEAWHRPHWVPLSE